jgi:hypothetical protein
MDLWIQAAHSLTLSKRDYKMTTGGTNGHNGKGETKGAVATLPSIRPWMITLLVFLAGQTLAAVWWAASINEKVKDVADLQQQFSTVVARVDTALSVLQNHGTELADVRKQIARQQGVDDQIRAEISTAAGDQFKGVDWIAAKRALDERREADLTIGALRLEAVVQRINTHEKQIKLHIGHTE